MLILVCCISRSVLLQAFNFLLLNICRESIIPLKASFVFMGKEMAKVFTDTLVISKGIA